MHILWNTLNLEVCVVISLCNKRKCNQKIIWIVQSTAYNILDKNIYFYSLLIHGHLKKQKFLFYLNCGHNVPMCALGLI